MKLSVRFTLFFLTLAIPGYSQTAETPAGAGTSGDPYLIASLSNLYWVTQNPDKWGSCFKQTENINAAETANWESGAGFAPIGTASSPFHGNYNGNYKVIDSLEIHRGSDFNGFFGVCENGALYRILLTHISYSWSDNIGGLAGAFSSSSIEDCYVSGSVQGGRNTGGLCGYCYNSTISRSVSAVSVSGAYDTGGLSGMARDNSMISNCYVTGPVSAGFRAGGIIGFLLYGSSIQACFSTGAVSGGGGLLGANTSSTLVQSVWDTETSGTTWSEGGTGKTTPEMKTLSTFLTEGWDFTGESDNGTQDIWGMDGIYNDGYPYLKWQENQSETLPVELVSFTATVTGNSVVLRWTTATETHNAGFELLRRTDQNPDWVLVCFIEGKGTVTTPVSYSYTDKGFTGCEVSYRLRQVDVNGDGSFSRVISVRSPVARFELLPNYPNPFNPETKIPYSLPVSGWVSLKVLDVTGREAAVIVNQYQEAGVYAVHLRAEALASGIYLLRLESAGKVQVRKITMVK